MKRWVLSCAVVGVVASGCSEGTIESASPVTSASSTSSAPDPLEKADPCTFVSAAEQAELGASDVKDASYGPLEGCGGVLKISAQTSVKFTVYVVVSTLEGYARGAKTEPAPNVGRHRALIEKDPNLPASCTVAVAAGNGYTVTNTVTGGLDIPPLCDLALRVAIAVEPDLPA